MLTLRISDGKSVGFSCTMRSTNHSTSSHGHISGLMQFSFRYRPEDSDCPLKPLNSKASRGLMGVFGSEAGGDCFLPHSPQKCVSSITQYSPHASSPSVMVGVRLLCRMTDSSRLLFAAQHISKVQHSHQRCWWKNDVPR